VGGGGGLGRVDSCGGVVDSTRVRFLEEGGETVFVMRWVVFIRFFYI